MPDRAPQSLTGRETAPEIHPSRLVVATKTAAPRQHVSPHLLDLKNDYFRPNNASRPVESSKSSESRIATKFGSGSDLQDVRALSLAPRARGWKDFPPPEATSVSHAVWLTVKNFFSQHPLADLTILTVVHLLAVLVWKIATLPWTAATRLFAPTPAPRETRMLNPLLPLAAVQIQTRSLQPQNLQLSLQRESGWPRRLLGFAGICLLLIMPFGAWSAYAQLRETKQLAMTDGLKGVSLLQGAGQAATSRKFDEAAAAFTEAERSFASAKENTGTLGNLMMSAAAVVPARSRISAAAPLLNAGKEIAAGGAALAAAFAAFDTQKEPTAKIAELRGRLGEALPHLQAAERSLTKISPANLPPEYAGQLAAAQAQLPKLNSLLAKAELAASLLHDVLGPNGTKRYLIVFQNNAELRPTGGFIGSFALVDMNRGNIKKVEIPGGGSYDLQGSLRSRISSPQPLHLINPNWEFQDANWYADFPSSARKISWFYEKSGGPTTDGVIAVTMSFMEDLLKIIGPVEMAEYGKTIDSDNFYFETQKEVELDFDKDLNQPKKFIADLAPKILERLAGADQAMLLKLTETLYSSLAEKQALFWFRDEDLESRALALGWGGEIRSVGGDYLQIVHTNIAGQKTDLVMRETVDHAVKILDDGTGLVTLTIRRTHNGEKGALFSGVRNVDYLRVYAPLGSTLVEAGGFSAPDPKLFKIAEADRKTDPAVAETEKNAELDRETGTKIMTESGKTVFGNWVMTDPGETSVVTLVYKLPPGTITAAKVNSGRLAGLYNLLTGERPGQSLRYSLLIQKQPGANPAEIATSIDLPRGYHLSWQVPERREDDRGRWNAAATLDRDLSFGAEARSN
ncbi:MAG: DUF4012 domain-containing protein [Patescibacteria group bacterium]